MYLKNLSLNNFKRFENTDFDLTSKITVLLGPNSSGKSSVIKAILALKQTAAAANENEVLAAQGEYVDLGVYRDYVFGHDIRKKIKIGFKTNSDKSDSEKIAMNLELGYDYTTEQARLFSLYLTVDSWENGTTDNITVSIEKKKTRDTFITHISPQGTSYIIGENREDPEAQRLFKIWNQTGISTRIENRYKITAEKEEPDRKFIMEHFPLNLTQDLIGKIFSSFEEDFFYIGPLRKSPSRSYARTGHLLSVGAAGEHTPSVLANLKSRAAKERAATKKHQNRIDELNGWIAKIFPKRKIDVRTVEEMVKLIVDREEEQGETISDVGFGVSQLLPILVQIAVMPEGSTLLLEQPELHLHPSVQTKFANVISEASDSGRRFIIETHSEHFVRGLQLAVSKAELARSSVTNVRARRRVKNSLSARDVHFLYVPEAPESPYRMEINQWGEFKSEWPSGFFDEAYKLASQLLENKLSGEMNDAFRKAASESNSKV